MAKITGGESSLLGGVSQQPVDRRLRGSLQELVNTHTDVLRGIERRAPIDGLGVYIPEPQYSKQFYKDFVLYDKSYLVRFDYNPNSTDISVGLLSELGEYTDVPIPTIHKPYLTEGDIGNLKITATDSGVYILNPDVVTAMTSQTTLPPYGAYINMTGTNYGRTYEILYSGNVAASTTIPVDSSALEPEDIQSEFIMSDLHTQLAVGDDVIETLDGSTMFLVPADDTYRYLDISLKDGDNGNYLELIQLVIPSTNKLPKSAVQDSVLTVRPNNGGKESEYYLKYTNKLDIYESESTVTEPTLESEQWESTHLTSKSRFWYASKNTRGYSTTLPDGNGIPISAGSMFEDTTFGGTITDWAVSTTSNDDDFPWDGYDTYAGQEMVLKVDWTNTDEEEPETIQAELDGTKYILYRESAGFYRTNIDLSGPTLDPYGFLKRNTTGIIRLILRSDSTPELTKMFQGGIWTETLQPNIDFRINPETMPVKLSRNDGIWGIDIVNWAERRVGNEENNEKPSFIGNKINDVSLVQSRLCFLTDDSIVFSRVDRETDFWRQSATTVVDDDRVDIESRDLDSGAFRSLTVHDKDIVVMGDSEQWVIRTANGVTPSSTVLQLASRYDNESSVDSASLGSSIAYPVWDGTYSQVREFYTRDDTGSNDSEYITSTVPRYIKGKITTLVSTTLNNYMVAHCAPSNELFVMQWHNQNGARVMQAWHKWTLPYSPDYIYFRDGKFKLVVYNGKATRLYSVDLSDDTFGNLDFDVNLDYRHTIALGSDLTIELPDYHPYTSDSVVLGASDSNYKGMKLPFTIVGDTLTLIDRIGTGITGSIIIGNTYESSITLSKLLPRDADDRVVSEQTLRINNLRLRHNNSGVYTVDVKRSWGDYYSDIEETSLSRSVGAARLNEPLLHTGEFRVPIRERSEFVDITITADSHLPYNLTGYDWSGQISGSGQRSNF